MIQKKQHAIVLGGSIGGLMTARVLSDYYKKVTIIEKDKVIFAPETRKGQPHAKHLHSLQYVALNAILKYFPNLKKQLINQGGIEIDLINSLNYYSHGGFKKKFNIGKNVVSTSRILLEHLIRENTLAIPNIELQDQSTSIELLMLDDKSRAIGIIVKQEGSAELTHFYGDLVVDSMGRGSRMPQWLEKMGYASPKKSKVKINLVYSTRLYEKDPEDPRGKDRIFYRPTPPSEKLGAGLIPIEGSKWILTLSGSHGILPSTKHEDVLAFLKSLSCSSFYNILSTCKPIDEAVQYRFKESVWRHYEKLNKFPLGVLVLGDAIFSFNPIYAQGMTSLALQVVELDKLLKKNTSEDKLTAQYFKAIQKIGKKCWNSSTIEDFRYPETIGKKPPLINLINNFLNILQTVSNKDSVVSEAYFNVVMMLKPSSSLFNPLILWRLIKFKMNFKTISLVKFTKCTD